MPTSLFYHFEFYLVFLWCRSDSVRFGRVLCDILDEYVFKFSVALF